jgi:flagellar biosynthesis/type III secretory pathway protein FliH
MAFMDKKSEDILKDILYKMKNDLDIDLNDTWIHSRIYQFLEDMWNAGCENGLDNGSKLEKEYERGYDNGYETGKQNARIDNEKDYDSGYEKGYAKGDHDGYQRALGRFNNPEVG